MSGSNAFGDVLIGAAVGVGAIVFFQKIVAGGGWCQQVYAAPAPGSVPVNLSPQIQQAPALFAATNPLCTHTLMGEPLAQWIPWALSPLAGYIATGSGWGALGGAAVDAYLALALSAL